MLEIAADSPSLRRSPSIARAGRLPAVAPGLAVAVGYVAVTVLLYAAGGAAAAAVPGVAAVVVGGVVAARKRLARVRADAVFATRARLVAAADEERRRVVRDLHDGAQQRLVCAVLTLQLAEEAIANGGGDAGALVAEARRQAQQATEDLRELARGIRPQALDRGGLAGGVRMLAERSPVPVAVEVCDRRLPSAVEATAYFLVAEALTNVAKHARASAACVTASVADGVLHVEVGDDGVGGADREGHGLVGLADRVAAMGGSLTVTSAPQQRGTRIAAAIPLPRTM